MRGASNLGGETKWHLVEFLRTHACACTYSVVDPDLELSGGGGLGRGGGGREAVFVLLALPAFLPSVIFSFLTQNKGEGAGSSRAPLLDPPLVVFRIS